MAVAQIFNFTVDEIKEMKTPEEIQEWESYMEKQINLPGYKFDRTASIGVRTTSCCGGRCDDCDEAAR